MDNVKHSSLLAVLAVAAFGTVVLSQQAPAAARTALTGATVIDVVAGTTVPNAVIVIDGDKIAAFGGSTTPIPDGAARVDLSGKFVIPGLFDSHVHYQPFLGELFLNYGVTSAMALGGRPAVGEKYWKDSHSPEFRAPRLFGTGRTNLGTLINPSMTRDQVRAAVQEWLKGEPDMAVMPQFSPANKQMWAWAAEAVHEAGLFTFGHTDMAPESVRVGARRGRAHLGFAQALMTPQELENYQRGEYLHWGLFLKDVPRMEQMIREAVQRGVYLNPTMGYELGSQSSLARKHEEPDVRPLPRRCADGVLPGESRRRIAAQVQSHPKLLSPAREPCSAGKAVGCRNRGVPRGVPVVRCVRETLGAVGRQDHGWHRRSISRGDRLQSAHGDGDARGGRAHADAGAQGHDDLGCRSHDGKAEGADTADGGLHCARARLRTSWCLAPTRSTASTTRGQSSAS